MSEALAVRGEQWSVIEWNQERQALARKLVCPATASDAEFALFIDWCKHTGLNPFMKQAFLVERRSKVKTPRGEEWVSKHEPMAAASGMLARVDALEGFAGLKSGVVYDGDEFAVNEADQSVTHKWSLDARKKAGNKVVGAWAQVQRAGRMVPVTFLPIEARRQDTNFWSRDPGGMILKCAQVANIRLACANLFSGVYIAEEMPDESPRLVGGNTATVAPSLPQTVAPPWGESEVPRPTPPGEKTVEASAVADPVEQLRVRIGLAATTKDLEKLVTEIKALPTPAQEALRGPYTKRSNELQAVKR